MLLWAVPGGDDGLEPLAISHAKVNFDAGPHPGSFAQAGTEGNLSLAPAHSYVRLQGFGAKQFSSGPCRSVRGNGIQLHGMGDGALRRRSIKLLSAGWLPHSVFRLGASPV